MKMIKEIKGEGLEGLLGERVTLFCVNYIYTGKLVGVNETCVKLEKAGVVYTTGAFSDTDWENCQSLPNDWYVQTETIESFGVLK